LDRAPTVVPWFIPNDADGRLCSGKLLRFFPAAWKVAGVECTDIGLQASLWVVVVSNNFESVLP
jgi:hypothetical protein